MYLVAEPRVSISHPAENLTGNLPENLARNYAGNLTGVRLVIGAHYALDLGGLSAAPLWSSSFMV